MANGRKAGTVSCVTFLLWFLVHDTYSLIHTSFAFWVLLYILVAHSSIQDTVSFQMVCHLPGTSNKK